VIQSKNLVDKLNLLADLIQQREQSDGMEYEKLVNRIRIVKAQVKELKRKEAAGEAEQGGLF
jgi:hypothetical protein